MELTLSNANYGMENNMGWNLPQFGFQKFVSETAGCILDAIHRSFDYKGKVAAALTDLVTCIIPGVALVARWMK